MLAYLQLLSTRAGQRTFGGVDAEVISIRGKASGSASGRWKEALTLPYWAASQPVLKIRAKVMHASNANLTPVRHFSTSAAATSNDMPDMRLTGSAFCHTVRSNGEVKRGKLAGRLL